MRARLENALVRHARVVSQPCVTARPPFSVACIFVMHEQTAEIKWISSTLMPVCRNNCLLLCSVGSRHHRWFQPVPGIKNRAEQLRRTSGSLGEKAEIKIIGPGEELNRIGWKLTQGHDPSRSTTSSLWLLGCSEYGLWGVSEAASRHNLGKAGSSTSSGGFMTHEEKASLNDAQLERRPH